MHEPALRPEVVCPASQIHHGPWAQVALEHLAIVTHGFDYPRGPGVVEAISGRQRVFGDDLREE